jgi:hypothetical protein
VAINSSNPDTAAVSFLAELLSTLEITYPDGETTKLKQIDQGFSSKPVFNPYVSVQAVGSRAPLVRLGHGAGMLARQLEIDLVVNIEYEDLDARRGAHRASQIRWDVFAHLAEHARDFPGFEIAQLDEAYVQAFNNDDGSFQEWGYIAQILIPVTVVLKGSPP